MRRLLASWLERTDATDDVRGAVLLATHEAAANAMTHGERDSPVRVSASQDEAGRFNVEITSHGPWKAPAAGHNGRGLAMMSELMAVVRTTTCVHMQSG